MKKVFMLFSDVITTRFMQAADVFEPFKVAIAPLAVVTFEENVNVIERCNELAEKSKDQPYKLIACFDYDNIYYQDESIKVVSTGKTWALINEYIAYKRSLNPLA